MTTIISRKPKPLTGGTWYRYLKLTSLRSPSALVEMALNHASLTFGPEIIPDITESHALDLGAGSHVDTEYLLNSGFKTVTSVDSSLDAKDYADRLSLKFGDERFRFHLSSFSDFKFEKGKYRLVLSNYALPMHGPLGFEDLVEQIIYSLDAHGVFACVFFGPKDEWYGKKPYAFTDKEKVERMIRGVGEYYITEENGPGFLTDEKEKNWHRIIVILNKHPK